MVYTITLEWDPEEEVYNVSVPALPGCYTWGYTRREAIANARDAIQGFLEVLREFGDPIPEEADLHRVRV